MKKFLAAAVIILVVGIVAVLIALGPLVSRAVKESVNRYGPRVAEAEVAVAEVDISPYSGSGTLNEFFVGNPEGFEQEERALSFGGINVKLDPGSVFGDRVIVEQVEITDPYFNLHQGLGSNNLQQLLNTIQENLGVGEQEPSEGGKQVIIREVIVRNARVDANVLGQKRTLELGDIELQGDAETGVTAATAVGQMMELILDRVMTELPGALREIGVDPDKVLGDVRARAQEALSGAEERVREAAGSLGEDAEGRAGEAVDQAREEIGRRLGGFLGGDEDEDEE
ncbi:MAG: hypothetical protein ACFB21_04095 [Opitutales bacterium]